MTSSTAATISNVKAKFEQAYITSYRAHRESLAAMQQHQRLGSARRHRGRGRLRPFERVTRRTFLGASIGFILAPSAFAQIGTFNDADAGSAVRAKINRAISVVDSIGISVKDYGALGDGTTDDTAAIVAAEAVADNTGLPLIFPPTANHYKVTDNITISDGVSVLGYGWFSKIQQYTREKNIFNSGSFCTFKDLHLIGDNGTTAVEFELNCGIYATGKKSVHVIDCYIEKCESAHIHMRDCDDVIISDNTLFAAPISGGILGEQSDIAVSSAVAGRRVLISGNRCYSNSSQGIYANRLGGDSDLIITDNHCITLDPATCTLAGAWDEIASGSLNRRHGIISSYEGNAQSRVVITNNICRNTLWTGIYCQASGSATGPVLVANNLCSKNAVATTDPSLSGGIFINVKGQEIITGNVILDFQSDDYGTAAINITAEVLPTEPSFVTGNYIINSLGQGIHVSVKASLLQIQGNTIYGSVEHDIKIALSAGDSAVGGHVIQGNRIQRTTLGDPLHSAINIHLQDGTNPVVVRDNQLVGFDNTSANAENCGIYVRQNAYTHIYRNHVEKFYYGIFHATSFASATRHFDHICEQNTLEACNTGIVTDCAATTSVVPLVDNVFLGCTTNTNNVNTANDPGYICKREDTKLVVFGLTAAPTIGTWVAGDRVRFTAPAAGAAPGSWCTTGGNPGTWKSEAALAA